MIFKKRKQNKFRARLKEVLAASRISCQYGSLDLERLFRAMIEKKFDCKIPATMTGTEFIAHLADIQPDQLIAAVRDIVDNGADPAKYNQLGIKGEGWIEGLSGLVAALYLLNEPEARAA